MITQADATVNVNGYTVVYDGNPHFAIGSAIGVKGESLTGLDLGVSFTNVPGGTADWTFNNINYKDQSGTVDVVITQADATVNVNGYTVVYDGNPHFAIGSAIGVKGESLTGLDLGASFTNVPGGTANWTFTDVTGNYNDQSGTADIVITQANATFNVSGYTGVYDGNPHFAIGSAIGVKGESLTGLNLGASFTNVPGGTANWTFTDVTGNYNDQSGTANIVISKANATIVVTPYNVLHDGSDHTATGTAKGVKGEPLTGLVLNTTHNAIGNYTGDSWTFTDTTGNYNNANGTIRDIIYQYKLTTLLPPYSSSKSNKSGSTVPIMWQFTNSITGEVVASPGALPTIIIKNSVGTTMPNNAPGNSALQYDASSCTWHWNWKIADAAGKALPIGNYTITISSSQTGQTFSSFPILVSK